MHAIGYADKKADYIHQQNLASHLYAATMTAPPIRSFSNSTLENFSSSNDSSVYRPSLKRDV